jgi:serine/threonine protein kinase
MKENEARSLFQQLVLAVDYCHKMGVANRDIKLENTLLSNRKPLPILKLTDFGFCKSDRDSSAKTFLGTPAYMGVLSKSPKFPRPTSACSSTAFLIVCTSDIQINANTVCLHTKIVAGNQLITARFLSCCLSLLT